MTKQIKLTRGMVALVDDDDFEKLNVYTWHVKQTGENMYAVHRAGPARKSEKRIYLLMHRIITGCPDGMFVDHINGNGLDNRKSNMRICTKSQNNRHVINKPKNKTGYKGFSKPKKGKKYAADIRSKGKTIRIGYFDSAELAARAYDEFAKRYYGEFAALNFPEGETK